ETQKTSYIKERPEESGSGTRIRYRGNTMQGSSGSPVVDARGVLVAIHHFSTATRNQGVPAAAIAQHLIDSGHGDVLTGAVRPVVRDELFEVIRLRGRPFVNRA